MWIEGIVEHGFGSAAHSLRQQKSAFEQFGVPGAMDWHDGSINVRVAALYRVIRPDYTAQVAWTREDERQRVALFDLVACDVEYDSRRHLGAYLYRKSYQSRHPPSVLEIVSPLIPNMQYGRPIGLIFDEGALDVIRLTKARVPVGRERAPPAARASSEA